MDEKQCELTQSTKALEIIKAVAELCAADKSLTFSGDWGYGSATITDETGAHTHIGNDSSDYYADNLQRFIDDLYSELVEQRGLTWVSDGARRGWMEEIKR